MTPRVIKEVTIRKFVCTADIHISIKKDIPEQWQVDRYHQLFTKITEDCVREEACLIIAGDLLDKAYPTLMELKLAFEFFSELDEAGVQVYLVSGNHETLSLGTSTFTYLKGFLPSNVSLMSGKGLEVWGEDTLIYFMSHCDLDYVRTESPNKTHILVTHFRTTISEYVREEIDTARLCELYDLVIAGDIHTDYEKDNLVYTNQPINSCFESKANTGYLLLEIDRGKYRYTRIKTELPSLIQVSVEAGEKFEVNDKDFYKITVTGELKELREVKSTLPNVKLVKVPVVTDFVPEFLPDVASADERQLDLQLVDYLKKVPYSESNISRLMDIWKEIMC